MEGEFEMDGGRPVRRSSRICSHCCASFGKCPVDGKKVVDLYVLKNEFVPKGCGFADRHRKVVWRKMSVCSKCRRLLDARESRRLSEYRDLRDLRKCDMYDIFWRSPGEWQMESVESDCECFAEMLMEKYYEECPAVAGAKESKENAET